MKGQILKEKIYKRKCQKDLKLLKSIRMDYQVIMKNNLEKNQQLANNNYTKKNRQDKIYRRISKV